MIKMQGTGKMQRMVCQKTEIKEAEYASPCDDNERKKNRMTAPNAKDSRTYPRAL